MRPIKLNRQQTLKRLQAVGTLYQKKVDSYNSEPDRIQWRIWKHQIFNHKALAQSLSSFKGENVFEHFNSFLLTKETLKDFNLNELSNDQLTIILPQLLITQIKSGRMFNLLCNNFNNNPDRPEPLAHTDQRRDMARTRIKKTIECWKQNQEPERQESTPESKGLELSNFRTDK